MSSSAYNSPGVSVTEVITPSIAPLIASPQIVALIGTASGEQSASDRMILSGTTAVQLSKSGVNENSVVVTLSDSGIVVNPGTYIVVEGADPDPTVSGDEPYTIARQLQPTVAVTGAGSGTGTLTGTYVYAYTFVNAGGETGIGPVSTGVALSNTGANLSAIAIGPSGTTARNIYRMKTSSGGDNLFHLIGTLNNNVATVLTNESTSDSVAQGDGVTTFGTATPPTGIVDGSTVIVSYTFADENYYAPTLLDNYNDIVAKYGVPFDPTDGTINSELSFAARIAFTNGASEILCVASASDNQSDRDAALSSLENNDSVSIVVDTGGTQNSVSSVLSHCTKMINQGLYRFGVGGLDGTATTIIPAATMRSAAQGLNDESLRLVNSSSFQMTNPVTGLALNVGGQYMAAAIAGMYAARDVQIPLTRKSVSGFNSINDVRTASDLALDSQSGLLVIQNRGGVLQVRHDLTTAIGSVNTAESSVVRAKYEMASRLQQTLDSSIIGLVTSINQAPLVVQGAVAGVLAQLITEGAINAYANIVSRALADPTTIEVQFSYTPAYPINNIQVVFTIDATNGSSTVTTS